MLPESMFSALSNFLDSLHCFDRCLDEFTVIADRDVATFFKLESGVLQQGYFRRTDGG